MAEEENLKEFPDVNHKLAAPKKLSAFEKERQAAQAKERRAEAENAAALKAFEDSFAYDNDADDSRLDRRDDRAPPPGPRGASSGPPGARYNAPPGPRSGPGSLGGAPPPPPSLKRKRALDEMRELQEARREQEMLGFDDGRSESRDTPQSLPLDEERELDAPRPTIQLSSLPPATTAEDIKALLRDHLAVHSVRFLPPAAPGTNSKRSLSAIATLASDVSTSQIDATVSTLKEKYLGCGFYLSISRHLSSAAMHPTISTTTSAAAPSSEPFGAEKPRDQHPRFSMRNAPPPIEHRGAFAPPDSYDTPGGYRDRDRDRHHQQPITPTVSVRPPLQISTLKAIHTIVDTLHLQRDLTRAIQIEAMLMSLPSVQRDERFAFLYDSRSPAGIYYRYLLWTPPEDEEDDDMKRRARGPEKMHEDVEVEWVPPYSDPLLALPFLDLKGLEEVVTEVDYVSSEESSDDEEDRDRKFGGAGRGDVDTAATSEDNAKGEKKYLSPLKRAKLVHLLSRLPTSNARLRKGDVARVTNFAINHAGSGAEEIVDFLLLNVEKPFSYSLASRYEEDSSQHSQDEDEDEDAYEPDEDLSNLDSPAPAQSRKVESDKNNNNNRREEDPSNSKLISLYLISDILSASSTAGARNAWKYRNLFESGFKYNKTFERLGMLEKELGWGRLKGEQWKRKVGVLLGMWEGWSVFPSEVLEELKTSFYGAGVGEEKGADGAGGGGEKEPEEKGAEGWMGRFRRVEQNVSPAPGSGIGGTRGGVEDGDGDGVVGDDVDGKPMDEDVDGKPMDDDIDGKPMNDDIDGVPMEDVDGAPMEDDVDGAPMMGLDGAADEKPTPPKTDGKVGLSISAAAKATAANSKAPGPRRRMRAEDMFADSDDE